MHARCTGTFHANCSHPVAPTGTASAVKAYKLLRVRSTLTVAITSDIRLSYRSLLYCMGVFWDKFGGNWATMTQRWRNLGIPPEVCLVHCHGSCCAVGNCM